MQVLSRRPPVILRDTNGAESFNVGREFGEWKTLITMYIREHDLNFCLAACEASRFVRDISQAN